MSSRKRQRTDSGYAAPRNAVSFAASKRGMDAEMRQRVAKEIKGVDTDISVATMELYSTTTSAGVVPVNLVGSGSSSFQRVGRKVYNLTVRINGVLKCQIENNAGSITSLAVRGMLVWDKQPNGSLPALSDIIGHTEPDGTEGYFWLDPLRFDNTGRFRILLDEKFCINGGSTPAAAGQQSVSIMYEKFLNLKKKNLESLYKAENSTPGIGDVSSGGLFWVWRADDNGATKGAFEGFIRFRYTD